MLFRVPVHGTPRVPGRLDLPEALDTVPEPPDVAGREILVCGGEPTLRADLPDLLRSLGAAAARTLATDGLSLAAPGVAQTLKGAVDAVRVPFPSGRRDAHDWLADRPGTAAARARGIRACVAAGLPVEAEITLTRPTTDHLGETVALLAELGVARILVRRPRIAGRLDRDAYLSLGPRLEAARAAIQEAQRVAGRLGVPLDVDGFEDTTDHVRALPDDAQSPAPEASPDGVLRLGWAPDEPTRVVRRRLVAATRGFEGRFRIAGPNLFAHPAALELLRDAARLGAEAVERDPSDASPSWPDAQRRRLPPIVEADAAPSRREGMLARERVAGRAKHWVRLVTACNSRCLFCLDSDTPRNLFLPVPEIRAELRRGREQLGADKVILSGGEGSLHPDFVELVAFARTLGYTRVQTVTNGWMWADRDFFEAAVGAGLDELTFSLHGHTEELHDHLTQHPGSYQRIVKAILRAVRARDRGVITNVDVVINKQNVAVIDKIVEFAIRLGVTEFDLLHVIPQASAYEHRDALFYDPSEHLEVLHKVFRLNRHPGIVVWTNRFPVAWLEGLEDLIQDPHKMLDEVNGRRFQLRNQLDHGTPLSCRQRERCVHCFIEPFCTATDRLTAGVQDHSIDVFELASGLPPERLPFGAALLGVTAPIPETPHPLYVRDADPADVLPAHTYVADTAAQVAAWLAVGGPAVDVELNRETSAALLAHRAALAQALGRVRIHQPGRPSVQAAVASDVRDPARFFAELDLPVAVSGLPACAAPGARIVPARVVLRADRFDPVTGRLDTRALAERHIETTYFGKSIRCRDCAADARCEGLPIQMVRDQGLRLARPLDVAPELPAPSPRLSEGRPPQGATPPLPGFEAAAVTVDPLRRLSADHAQRRRRRRLEVLGS